MAITYFYRDTASGLTGSPSEIGNFDLTRDAGGLSSQINTGNLNSGVTASCWFFTVAADPGTDGTSTGSFTLELRIDIQNADIGIRCYLQRYNSGGTAQGTIIEATEGSQTAGAATRQYNWTNPNLGTWSAGDRLGVRVQFTNDGGSMNQSCRLGANLSSDTLITPFTAGAATVEGSLAETQDSQTVAASGTLGLTGSLAETQDAHTVSASGTVGENVTGTLAETQADQTLAASGALGLSGSLAETQDDQTLNASGDVTGPPAGFTISRTPSATNSASTNHVVAIPDGSSVVGKTLVVAVVADVPTTVGWPSGWSATDQGATGVQLSVGRKIVDGTEGFTGTSDTITVTTSASMTSAHDAYLIAGAHASSVPEVATASGLSTTPDPPNLDPAGWAAEDNLWFAIMGSRFNIGVSAAPTNYTDLLTSTSTNGDNGTLASARRELNAAAENPGTFTIASSDIWVTATVAVRPGVAAGPTGTLAETQDNQTLAASGTIGLSGSLTETQDDQTLTATGVVGAVVAGSLSETQDDQTSSASGQIGHTGSLAETQADQTLTASGAVGEVTFGTLAETQAAQTLAAGGQLGLSGSLAETQANQTLAASGVVGDVTAGSLAETQADQTLAASGHIGHAGTLVATQDAQTVAASGWVETTGTVAATQTDQTLAASGTIGYTGSLAETQADQAATATGWVEATGTLAETQDDQTLAASGFIGERETPAERIYVVPAETRAYVVPVDTRALVVT